ncbi:DUF4145 domain-containing protein [Geodermatophilus sp. SYSU D00696]
MPEESNPDTLPTPRDPTGPCPWCGRISNFDVSGGASLAGRPGPYPVGWIDTHALSTLKCSGCKRTAAVITDETGRGIHWYPAPGMGLLDRQVNKGVASAYDEGMRCLGIGANRAAAVMFRSALSLFVKDKGSEAAKKERHLKNALKHMKADNSLHPSLSEWADHLNQLGNEGAHPEDYDDVTAKEAEELGKFVRHLIHAEYELPAQLRRARGLLKDEPEDNGGAAEESGSGGLPSASDLLGRPGIW